MSNEQKKPRARKSAARPASRQTPAAAAKSLELQNAQLREALAESQRVQDELRASEARFRAFADQATDAFILHDNQGTILEVNRQACESLGYTREELIGLTPFDFDVAMDKAFLKQLAVRLDAGETVEFETHHRRKDGNVFPVEVCMRPFQEGGQRFGVSIARDLTEQRQAEEARREVEQNITLMDFALNNVQEAAFLTDEHARFQFVNEESCRILGYTRAELLSLSVPDIDPDFPLARWHGHWSDLKAQRSLTFEGRHKAKDGRIFPVEINANYFEYNGRGYNLALVHDITARTQAEQERLAHLHFYESLDRVNRAMRGTHDLEQMMSDVLDLLLSIFECDRAWLVHPCDPEAATWQVSMERTRPEYPGVLPLGVELPLDPAGAAVYRILRDAPGPVQFNPAAAYPVPIEMAQGSGVQSFIALALFPKVGRPWSFGLHQCAYPRRWTPEEERLFQEIGRRLSDGLTSLLMLRNLHERERHSQSLLRLSKALESAQTYDQVVNAALEEVKISIGYQNLWVYLLTDDKKQATALVAGGHMSGIVMSGEGIATLTIEGDPMLEAIAAATELVVIADAQIDERTNKEIVARLGNRTIVNVPIQLLDRHLGSVGVGTFGAEGVRVPSKSEEEYLRALASHLAVTLDRIQLLEQREQAAESLTHERNLLRTLIDHIPDFIYIKDVESRFLIANTSVAQHMGAASPVELVGRTDWDFYPPERAAQFYADERAVVQSGKPLLGHDEPNADAAGNLRWIMTTKLPMRDSHGQIIGLVGIGHDLTERKQAEQERQAHLRFLASMDQINRAIQGTNNLEQMMSDVLDVVLSIFDCDRAFLMYPCDPEAASWKSPMERTRPEYPGILALGIDLPMDPDVAETLRLLLNSDGPVKFGAEAEHPLPADVTERFGIKSFMSMALHPKVGKPWQFGVHQCSYERVWTREEEQLLREIGRRLSDALTSLLTLRNLQESEAKFSTSFRSSPSALSVSTAKDHVYVDVNDSFLEWTGYTRAEVIGHTSGELQLWANPDQNREFRRLLHEDGSVYNFEYAYRRQDGVVRYALVSATFITLGGERCVLAQSNDITDRKQAEETLTNTHLLLQQSLKFTEALLSAIPTPVFYKDREGRYLGCNRAFSEVMGVTSEEIKGKTVFELWPGEHAQLYHDKDVELIGNPSRQVYEFRVRDKAGLERPVVYVKDVFRDENDQVAGIVGAFLDITERKQAEEALRHLNRELRAISNCNQTLLRAVDEQTLLNDICRIVCDEAGYRMAWVGYAESDEARTVRPVAWAGVEAGYLAQAHITWADTERGRGPTGTAIRSGESAFIQDFMTDPQAAPWRENALQRGYRSSIALPLKDESAHTFGALTIYATEPNAFTPDEVRLLEELAGDLAFGITALRTRAERQRAEEALWESSQMLQLVLDNIPAYVFWKDRNCVYLGCNYLSAVNSGLSSPQDIVGLTDFDLPWKDTHAELYRADDREVMETGLPKLNYEETQLTAAGRVITMRTSKVPLRNPAGDVIGVLGMFEDITERKRAEMALWESSQMLQLVLDNMPAYVFWKDHNSVYLGCNNRFAANAGLSSPQAIVGLTDLDLPWRDSEAQSYRADDRQVMETGLPKLNYEETQLTADGRLAAVRTSKIPLRNPAGDVIGVLGTFEDITERKRAEEALRESQALYRSFVEQLPNPVFRKDSDGRYVMVNSKFCQLKGVKAEDFLGRTPTEIASRELAKQGESGQAVKYAAQGEEIHELIMRTGQVVEMVEEHAVADGRKHYMHVIRMPVFDSEGKIVGTQGIQFDITERVRAEEALQDSESRYRLLAENASDIIFTMALDLKFTYVSPSVTRVRGYSVEEALAQTLDQVLTPTSLGVALQAFTEEMAFEASEPKETKRTRILELEETCKDGSTIWTETTVTFLRDSAGQAIGLIGITRDITERRRAEEEIYTLNQELEQRVIVRTAELAQAHEHLRAILDTAGEGVVFTDLHGTIEYINPAMERLTGYQATEVIGRNPRIWKSNQTPTATHRQMWSALTGGEIWQGELINRRKDGALYDAALTTAPLTDPEGQIVGFVGVQRDISRQKELDRLKDQFVSNVSHELRTPLANILLHVGLLEHGKPDKLPSYLQTLRREAERLRKLIEDLLDLSRLDRNVAPIQLAPIDLNQLLEQLVTDRVALAEQRGLALTYEPTPDLPPVLTDTSQLIQVASNLLTNALNYTLAGGAVSVRAEVRRQAAQNMVAFTVRDTGPGISAQDMAHLFERFYRGAASRRASAPGTGLGLAISQEVMKRLGGRITVESEVGQGAAFTVWLPIV